MRRVFRDLLSNLARNSAENVTPRRTLSEACGKLSSPRPVFRHVLHKAQNEDSYTFESLTGAPSFSARSSVCFF